MDIHYQKQKDFTKADSITQFKKEMQGLLKGADPTVIDLYERKSFDELGIQLLIGSNVSYYQPNLNKFHDKLLIDVNVRLIQYFDLLMENKYYDKIKDNVSLTQIINPDKRNLYKEILYYYR